MFGISQVFNFLPFNIKDMYADDMDFRGIEYWYKEAVRISEENKKAMKSKR